MPVYGFICCRRLTALMLTLALLLLAVPSANAQEKAVIQLKWLHHFQFAGYYMALEKGFYRDAGLDVTIREGGPNVEIENEVASGRADFGVGTSALLLYLAQGQDFVVLAQVFQHSPAVFLTPRKTGIRSVRDMAGMRFMHFTQHGDMLALLKKNGIDPDQVNKVPQRGDPRDLIEGKADVMLAYSFNEPYVMELAGEPYFTFSPLSFGIDFYGDNLFSTDRLVKERPGFVKAFRAASLQGWRYALEHKEETIDLILSRYPRGLSREHLMFEADHIDTLIQPNLVELGYQSPARWQRIRDTFADLGMMPKSFDPTPIIYTPDRDYDDRTLFAIIIFSVAVICGLSWLVLSFWKLNVRLRVQIAERLQVETALKESEERFRTLMETIPSVAVQGYYLDGTVHFWNRASELLYGFSAEEAVGGNLLDLIIPLEMKTGVREAIRQMEETGEPIPSSELLLLSKDGSRVAVFSSHALLKPLGRPAELFCLDIDLTDRKLAEEALRKSQELFALFMKHTPVYTFIKQIEGDQSRIIMISDNFIDMVGKPAAELSGRTMYEIFPADFARKVTDDDVLLAKEGKVVQLDEELDGRSYTTIKFPIVRKDDNTLIAGFTLDITERRKSEALLRESDERFRLAFENANIGMCLVDAQGKLIKVNRQMSEIFGYRKEELEGMTVNDIAHPDYQEVSTTFMHLAESGAIDHSEFEKAYIHKEGRLVWGQVSSSLVRGIGGEPLYFISHVKNITKRKQAEEERLTMERQLLHTQKLESLGVLAGGIAHDFNNILMAIIGNADLALMKLNPESPVVSNLHQIEQSAMRAADLAKQMLAYSGKGKFQIEILDMNRLLEEMLHMLEISISKKALLRLNLAPHLPVVEADATQIRQIIMNLVINASEAIGDESGVIAITTGSMECDDSSFKDFVLNEGPGKGLYVYLEITDTGCGMDKEILSRLFDPFFTTKFTGRGLGMAAVHGIVRGHKGAMKVSSEPGRGTTFKMLLPTTGSPAKMVRSESGANDWQGSGTVLLVDDEPLILTVGAELLKALGFTVVTANDGKEALEVYKATADIICVILDLTMPHMDGEQCFQVLRQINPAVKVIMSSGYSEHEVAKKFVGLGVAGFIQKPYALSALREVLKKTV